MQNHTHGPVRSAGSMRHKMQLTRGLTGLIVIGAMCATASSASPPAAPPQVAPKTFDIFVDPPTGFVFVKLPKAWKFVGKLSAEEVDGLPASVITSLLPAEPGDGWSVSVTEPRPKP